MKELRIAVIAGDGIGKEVMPEGIRCLDAVAGKYGIRFVGPNCAGIVSTQDHLLATLETRPPEGNIAIISQSGAVGGTLMAMAKAVANEIGHRDCKRLTFETESGTVVFQAVNGSFPAVLCLVVDQNALLGRALWAAGEVATGYLPS